MRAKISIKISSNFEQNLADIENFLEASGAGTTYDELLTHLSDTVILNLERFPDIGRLFLDHPVLSMEANNAVARLKKRLKGAKLHELLIVDYLLLYARYEESIVLLSIRHHRQLSFDLHAHWVSGT